MPGTPGSKLSTQIELLVKILAPEAGASRSPKKPMEKSNTTSSIDVYDDIKACRMTALDPLVS